MSGIEDARKAVEAYNQQPTYLRLKWQNLLEAVLEEQDCTVNEICRLLGFGGKQRHTVQMTLYQMRLDCKVRWHGRRFRVI